MIVSNPPQTYLSHFKLINARTQACERGNKRAVELLLKGFDDTDVNILQRISNNDEEKKTITPIETCAKMDM